MFGFYFISAVVVLTGVFAYINQKVLRLPNTIGLMLLSTVFSLIVIGCNFFAPQLLSPALKAVGSLDFSKVVIDMMLCFLLFAGAMHTDYDLMRQNRKSIILFSLVSVVISTFLVGTSIFYISGMRIPFLYCLLFGAIMSPTDPVAVLGILTKANVPKKAEIIIVGESLFNDGIGVVVFISLLSVVINGGQSFNVQDVLLLFAQQAGGGLALGLLLGYIIFFLLKSIDDYETEVILTLAIVFGGNWLSHLIHVSGPLAMVIAGLMTGHKTRKEAMSETSKIYIDKFWHLMDVFLNAILFVLIGLKILSIHLEWSYLIIALCMLPFLILCRYLALFIPYVISKKWLDVSKSILKLMTWGGLRGGLSIAMALSLPGSFAVKDEFVFITYVVVFFSIFVQGLTIGKFAKRLVLKDSIR